MPVLFGTKCIWQKKRILSKTKVVCNTKHAFALRLRVQMFIMILKCICSNVPKNLLIICPHPPLTPPSPLNRTVFTQRRVSDHVYEVNIAIATWSPFLSMNVKIPAWYCREDEAVVLFDSYFTFESKLGWHRLFLTVESTRGIRTLVVVFELLEEMVAWGW